MKNSITILLLCLMTINLMNSQDVVDIANTIEKQVDGETILFVNNEKYTGIVLQDWENKTHSKTYKEGKLNGLYKTYYSHGNLAFYGNFKSGKKQGLCKWYYKNGNLELKGNYDNGNPNGLFEWFYENGKIKQRSNIKNGKYTSTQVFPEKEEYVIRDSLIDSLSNAFDESFGLTDLFGEVLEVPISKTELKKEGGHDIRYFNGKKFTGTALEYYPSGSRKFRIGYINGNKDMFSKFYYENGNLEEKGKYDNGLKNGLYEWYYENGNIKQKGNFDNDLEYGLFEWYYDNGNIWYRVSYKIGERNGYYTEFRLNGHLKWKGIFRNDKWDGDWTEYDSNGEFIQTLTYKSGEIIK